MTKPRSRQVKIIAQLFLFCCSLLFAYGVQNQVRWILIPSAVVLWIIVVVGYANLIIWIFKDGLIALAKKSKSRNVGWIPFITSSFTIAMVWRQGWLILSAVWAVLLLSGLLLRVLATEKQKAYEVTK